MRILITGASGSGTTTLGMAVASRLHWHFIDTDDYFWLPTQPPFQTQRDTSDRLKMIVNELNMHEVSVTSGSVMDWGHELENSFDLIVFLYLDTATRLNRLRLREEKELGRADPEFLSWASEYDTGPSVGRSLKKHQEWLSNRTSKVLHIEGDLRVDERSGLILDSLPN